MIGCLSWSHRADHVSNLNHRNVKSIYTTRYATDNVTVIQRQQDGVVVFLGAIMLTM